MRLKVLIISDDVVGKKMAGPGIRAWEFARELNKHFDVSLAIPEYSDFFEKGNFPVNKFAEKNSENLINVASKNDVIITQGYILNKFPQLNNLKLPIVVDLYVPFVLENIFNNMFRLSPLDSQSIFKNDLKVYMNQLKRGNLFLVANESQFDLIVGSMLVLEKINPIALYNNMEILNNILIIPYGYREEEVREEKEVLKEKIGFSRDDFLLIWGGVITNWFDPITLIKAMEIISKKESRIKLLFLSTKHANSLLPAFDMARLAMEEAKNRNLIDKNIFFNKDWIPYKERWEYFGAADVGVSTHKIHIETKYSFRTRFLDYLSFKLPIIATKGDYLSEYLFKKGALIKVEENDYKMLAEEIIKLYRDEQYYERIKRKMIEVRENFKWEQVLSPLVQKLKKIEEGKIKLMEKLPVKDKEDFGKKFIKNFPFFEKYKNSKFAVKLRRHLGKK